MSGRNSFRLSSKSWSSLEVRSGGLFLRPIEPEFVKPTVTRKLRVKFLRELRKQREVVEVMDLFDKDEVEWREWYADSEIGGRFLPLICLLRVSTTRDHYKSVPCMIVIDGYFFLLALLISREDQTEFFVAARKRIFEVAKRVSADAELVAPSPTHESMLLTNRSKVETPKDIPCMKLQDLSLKAGMKQVYIGLESSLTGFYLTARTASHAEVIAHEIRFRGRELLKLIQGFITSSIHQVLARHSMSKKIRVKMTTLLDLLMQYNEMKANVTDWAGDIERKLHDENIGSSFLGSTIWKEYVDCGKVDTEAILTAIDHARSEMESSGIESVTIWAAMVTALVALAVAILSVLVRP